MKQKKTFFDEDIKIDEKLFNNFKLENIASWSHLELWCAIQNVEVNYEFFKGILCGINVISKLYDVILDAICNTEFLDKYLNEAEVIEIIEKIFSPLIESRTFAAQEFWIEVAFNQAKNTYYNEYMSTGIIHDNYKKFQLLNAIFKKSPFAIIKFYDKHKMTIHRYDISFEKWLLKSFSVIKDKSELHSKVYDALCIEEKKQNKLAMFMN